MPKSITWKKGLKDFEVQATARRIGLIPFQTDYDQYQVELKNEGETSRIIRAEEICDQNIASLCSKEILTVLPPGEMKFKIQFDQGRGIDSARYDLTTKTITPEKVKITHPGLESKEILPLIKKQLVELVKCIQ